MMPSCIADGSSPRFFRSRKTVPLLPVNVPPVTVNGPEIVMALLSATNVPPPCAQPEAPIVIVRPAA